MEKRKRDFIVCWGFALVMLGCLGACGPGNPAGSGEKPIENVTDSTVSDTASLEFKLKKVNRELEFSPKNPDLYYERSLLLYAKGNTEGAKRDIDLALDYNDQEPQHWHLKGYYAYVQNDNELALKLFNESARMGSENPETFYTMGQIHFFKGEYEDAGKYYDIALELDSTDPTYFFAKAFLYETEGKLGKAEQWYNLSLERNPGFVKSLSQLHDIYLNRYNEPGRASLFNDRILGAEPNHPIGLFNQGNMFYRMANTISNPQQNFEFEATLNKAITEYSRAVQSDPTFTKAYYNRGYCFFLLDNYDQALSDFNQVIEMDPHNERAHFMKGSITEFFGDFSGALDSYEEALRINPDFGDAKVAATEMRAKLGKK